MSTDMLGPQLRQALADCPGPLAEQMIAALRKHIAAVPLAPEGKKGNGVKKLQKTTKSVVPAGAPKRPLNSWMAFRKFYSTSLAPYTQKAISKVLVAFWHDDPFKAKWVMLAKAYSVVRGSREKKEAPLDEFFTICAPLVGVIPQEEYQQWMGWQVLPTEADPTVLECARVFVPDLNSFPEEFTTTTMGVDDLVSHCYAVGYVQISNDTPLPPGAGAPGSLAMVSLPTSVVAAAPVAAHEVDVDNSAGEELRQTPVQDLVEHPSAPTGWSPPLGLATLLATELGQPLGFNPAAPDTTVNDEGAWNAYDPSRALHAGDELNENGWREEDLFDFLDLPL